MSDFTTFEINGDEIDLYWIEKCDGYNATNTKDGNAYGAFGFDRRHYLVQFMKFCVEQNKEKFEGFKPFIKLGSGSPALQNNEELAKVWNDVYAIDSEFVNLQNQYAYSHYYTFAKNNCLKAGLDIANYSRVFKGTLWLFITKFGIISGCKKILAPFKQHVTDELDMIHKIFSTTSIDPDIAKLAEDNYKALLSKTSIVEQIEEPNTEVQEENVVEEESVEDEVKPVKLVELDHRTANLEVIEPIIQKKEDSERPHDAIKVKVINSSFDKKAKYKVCTDWKQGYAVNLKYASNYYEEAKERAIEIANETRKIMYVYGDKGQKLFMYDPKKTYPDVPDGYRVGTGMIGSTVQNEVGAFTKFDNAKRWADISTSEHNKTYKVYLNQDLKYTSNVKVK